MHDKLNCAVWKDGHPATGMEKYKAVIFDLFETLITEWGHKKYTKREMCADLGIEWKKCIPREKFNLFWDEKEEERYCGKISFEDSIRYVCERCGRQVADSVLAEITDNMV